MGWYNHGDKYLFIESNNMDDFELKINSKACEGYELVTMMNAGNSFSGANFIAAMTKSEEPKQAKKP